MRTKSFYKQNDCARAEGMALFARTSCRCVRFVRRSAWGAGRARASCRPAAVSPDTWASIARGTRFFNVRTAYLSRAAHTFPLGLTRRRLFERAPRTADSVPTAGKNAVNRTFCQRLPAVRLCLTNKHSVRGSNFVVSLLYKPA